MAMVNPSCLHSIRIWINFRKFIHKFSVKIETIGAENSEHNWNNEAIVLQQRKRMMSQVAQNNR